MSLLGLLAEICSIIYHYVLSADSISIFHNPKSNLVKELEQFTPCEWEDRPSPAIGYVVPPVSAYTPPGSIIPFYINGSIIPTCKLAHAEAAPILYSNLFIIDVWRALKPVGTGLTETTAFRH